MRTWTTLVLAVVALGLGAFIFFHERHTVGTSERVERRGRLLEAFDRTRVRRVELDYDGRSIVLLRDEGENEELRLEHPIRTHADEDAVEALLGALDWAIPFRTIEGVSDEDRERFGLEDPFASARLFVGERPIELLVGAEAPGAEGRYAAVGGREDRAFVISADLVEALSHDVVHFRGKRLFPSGFVRISRLERQGEGGDFLLEERDGALRLEAPEPMTAHQGRIEALQKALEKLEASRFLEPGATAEEALGEPRLTLRLEADGERHTLEVFGPCPESEGKALARVDEGEPLCVDEASLDEISVPRDELRERRLATLRDYDVKRAELRLGSRRLLVDLADDPRYELYDGEERVDEGEADEAAFTDWLRQMRRVDALRVARLPQAERGRYGLERPRGMLELVERGPLERRTLLHVGDETVSALFARREGDDVLLELPAEAGELLRPAAYRVKGRMLLDAEPHEVTAIHVTEPGGERRAIEPTSLPELTSRLAALEAVRLDADEAEPRHGLAEPRLRLEFELAPGHHHGHAHGPGDDEDEGHTGHRVEIGADTEDGIYARVDEDRTVYVLNRALLDAVLDDGSAD